MNEKSQYVADQAQTKVYSLMRQAMWRANFGMPPTQEAVKARSRVECDEDTGRILVRWDGQVILTISASPAGMSWEFLGAAAHPIPAGSPVLIGG